MKDHEIIELYWARNESAITTTAEKYGITSPLKAPLLVGLTKSTPFWA